MEFPEENAKTVDNTDVTFWKPLKEGDQLVGILVSSFDNEEFGTTYILENEDGRFGTPSHAVLQNKLKAVPQSAVVRITFTGLGVAKPKQSAPKLYNVEYAV